MSEREAAVDDEAALGLKGPLAGLVEVGQGGRVGHVERREVEVLEDELVGGALDGWEGEEGLRQEKGRLGRVDPEKGGEEVGPDLALEIRVD